MISFKNEIKYHIYGELDGIWNFAPGSKSSLVRTTGEDTPWYSNLRVLKHNI